MRRELKTICEKHNIERVPRPGGGGLLCRECHRGYKRDYYRRHRERIKEAERLRRERKKADGPQAMGQRVEALEARVEALEGRG